MLENESLRAALALVMGTLLVLFYFITYRTGRSAFAGWWCLCLAVLILGSLAQLVLRAPYGVWTVPFGHAANVFGVGCLWAGARSLRLRRTPWWWLAVAPVVVAGLAVAEGPDAGPLTVGGPLFAAHFVLLAVAAVEMAVSARVILVERQTVTDAYRRALWSLVLATAAGSLLYLGRWLSFIIVGPDRPPFTTLFGEEATTLFLVVALTTAAFNMSMLSDELQKRALSDLVARDGLTGLLNRRGFLGLAEERLARATPGGGQVVLADLDHFKQINDEHGHGAGDRAITAFAEVCTAAVRSSDLVGRYGGEEFVLLLPGAGPERAHQVTEAIGVAMAERAHADPVLPTVSFGISAAERSLDEAIDRADRALYRAKELGRDRTVHHDDLT